MDNLLIDRETLGKFVDELIKQKPLAVDNAEQLNSLRENAIKKLDDAIGQAVFSQLSSEQHIEVNQLLDREDTSEEEFRDFFERSGVNIEQVVADAMTRFGKNFLEGGIDER